MLFKDSFCFSRLTVPSIDLSRYLSKQAGWEEDCKRVSQLIQEYGLLYAKDPRIDERKNGVFLDLMEAYFQKRDKQFKQGIKLDVSDDPMPVGLYYAFNQKHISYKEEKTKLKNEHRAKTPLIPTVDPGFRFHWVHKSQSNIVPSDFSNFVNIMNDWSGSLFQTGFKIAQMTAIGLGLPKDTLSKYIINGPTYLSPPAVDLMNTKVDDIIGAFHRDFDLFTVHGKCRYAGLHAWLLTGERFVVDVPNDHFLVQGGKQLQWITGGYLKAGFHQVVHTQLVQRQKDEALKNNMSTWRVASTTFCHVTGNMSIKPLGQFRSAQVDRLYPDLTADQYIYDELKLILFEDQ